MTTFLLGGIEIAPYSYTATMNRIVSLSPEALLRFVDEPVIRRYVSKVRSSVKLQATRHVRNSVLWGNGFARNPEAFIDAEGRPDDVPTLLGLHPLALELVSYADLSTRCLLLGKLSEAGVSDLDIEATLATGVTGEKLTFIIRENLRQGFSLLQLVVGTEMYSPLLYARLRRPDIPTLSLMRYSKQGNQDPLDMIHAIDNGWPEEYLDSAS